METTNEKSYGFECFCVDGLFFKGNLEAVRKEYEKQNPSKKWVIWLIDKGLEL